MSILDSAIAPYLVTLTIISVLAGFFRKTLIHLFITIGIFTVLLGMFPVLLVKYVGVVSWISNVFR